MREKETRETSASSTAATRCTTSTQVKQKLTLLGDGETRRNALNSLKQTVEGMDSASVPRFVGQVSEAKESSRAHAIALYEDVARVHGKLMIPHIPRVMATVTKSLSSSGSSPQLQQTCAKVVCSVAKHAIDDESPPKAADVLRGLCDPLLEVLTGKLEPLAAGAATCLQVLVESENWKFAPSSVIEDLCLKITLALSEKGTRTVAHMQLGSSLAASNSAFLASYGVTLLRSGVEILKSSAASWQQRAGAARLLTAVLPTVDRATLAEELSTTVQALVNCKHDRMSNVRWAVKEALKTAKGIISEENIRRFSDGDELLSWIVTTPEPSTTSPRRISLGGVSSDDMVSPPDWTSSRSPKSHFRSSPVSSVIPLSPSAPLGSPRRVSASASAAQALDDLPYRPPLQAARLQSQMGTLDNSVASFHDLDSPRKENLPSHDSDINIGALSSDSDLSPSKPAANDGAVAPNPSSTEGSAGLSPEVAANGHQENTPLSPDPLSAMGDNSHLEANFLAEEVDAFMLPNELTPSSESGQESQQQQLEMKTSREGGIKESPANGGAFRINHGVLNGSSMKHVFELKGASLRSSPRTKDEDIVAAILSSARSNNVDGNEATNGVLGTPLRVDSPVHLTPFEVPYSPKTPSWPSSPEQLLGADDIPFSTPRRLVRSLQDSFASPKPASTPARYADADMARLLDEDDVGDRVGTDMDLGTPTSSGTGWSVRTNPIASDESLRAGSDDSDDEQGRAALKKMVLQPSFSPTPPAPHTRTAQETDNPDIDDDFRQRLDDPTSAAASVLEADESSEEELGVANEANDTMALAEMALELQPEISDEKLEMKRFPLDLDPANFQAGSTTGNGFFVDGCSCSDSQSVRGESESGVSTASDVAAKSEEGNEMVTTSVSDNALPVVKYGSMVLGMINRRSPSKRSWRERPNFACFGWHWCAVIVAIPFAFALLKVVFQSDPRLAGYLVPT